MDITLDFTEIVSNADFNEAALKIFHIQAAENPVYSEYLRLIGCNAQDVGQVDDIPFLPIEFFKTKHVLCNGKASGHVFRSSGTGSGQRSRHVISSISLYHSVCLDIFKRFYGSASDYCFLALMPSFADKPESSLSCMLQAFINASRHEGSGFYLKRYGQLTEMINKSAAEEKKCMLIGLTHALLEFAEHFHGDARGLIVVETGGMKGKGKELVREELHNALERAFGLGETHSEYGMCELMSQAYSTGNGLFKTPPWMNIQIRDIRNPFAHLPPGKVGGINIIDLANVHSCSFIETSDIGKLHQDGSFEVLGRIDRSEQRGCNLLLA